MKVLLVEDQKACVRFLKYSVNEVLPECSLDFAGCYNDARENVVNDLYDMVLLDHQLPREEQGNLEFKDLEAYVCKLEGVGYELMGLIRERNPGCVVVGTSSCSAEELGGMTKPDYVLNKSGGNVVEDLEVILNDCKGVLKDGRK